jgi:hypothetical protein
MDDATYLRQEVEDDEEHVGTPGSYLINVLYIVLFFLAYLWAFYELSHRWAVG